MIANNSQVAIAVVWLAAAVFNLPFLSQSFLDVDSIEPSTSRGQKKTSLTKKAESTSNNNSSSGSSNESPDDAGLPPRTPKSSKKKVKFIKQASTDNKSGDQSSLSSFGSDDGLAPRNAWGSFKSRIKAMFNNNDRKDIDISTPFNPKKKTIEFFNKIKDNPEFKEFEKDFTSAQEKQLFATYIPRTLIPDRSKNETSNDYVNATISQGNYVKFEEDFPEALEPPSKLNASKNQKIKVENDSEQAASSSSSPLAKNRKGTPLPKRSEKIGSSPKPVSRQTSKDSEPTPLPKRSEKIESSPKPVSRQTSKDSEPTPLPKRSEKIGSSPKPVSRQTSKDSEPTPTPIASTSQTKPDSSKSKTHQDTSFDYEIVEFRRGPYSDPKNQTSEKSSTNKSSESSNENSAPSSPSKETGLNKKKLDTKERTSTGSNGETEPANRILERASARLSLSKNDVKRLAHLRKSGVDISQNIEELYDTINRKKNKARATTSQKDTTEDDPSTHKTDSLTPETNIVLRELDELIRQLEQVDIPELERLAYGKHLEATIDNPRTVPIKGVVGSENLPSKPDDSELPKTEETLAAAQPSTRKISSSSVNKIEKEKSVDNKAQEKEGTEEEGVASNSTTKRKLSSKLKKVAPPVVPQNKVMQETTKDIKDKDVPQKEVVQETTKDIKDKDVPQKEVMQETTKDIKDKDVPQKEGVEKTNPQAPAIISYVPAKPKTPNPVNIKNGKNYFPSVKERKLLFEKK